MFKVRVHGDSRTGQAKDKIERDETEETDHSGDCALENSRRNTQSVTVRSSPGRHCPEDKETESRKGGLRAKTPIPEWHIKKNYCKP